MPITPVPSVAATVDIAPVVSPIPQQATPIQQAATVPDLIAILFCVWACGAALVLLYMLLTNVRFYISVKQFRKRIDWDFCLPVYRMDGLVSPCLCGYFHPAVLVNEAALRNDATLAFVLQHELCHFRTGDQWWALVRNLCCTLHWFNPIVWWAAFKSRADCELACDAGVMKEFTQTECERYGIALLSIIPVDKPVSNLIFTTTSMTGGKRELKSRMRNIGKRPKTVWLAAAAAMMCLVTDERNYQFVNTNLTSYEGVLTVREATRFHPMYNIASWASHAAWFNEEPPKLMTGEETTGFERINKDIDLALPDIWRSNISYFYPLQAPASAVYQIQSLDATAILNAYCLTMARQRVLPPVWNTV